MEAIIEHAAGLDVHQATVVAAVLIGKAAGRSRKEVRTFGTMTQDLEALREWLHGLGVTHVGMESTWSILDASLYCPHRAFHTDRR